MKKWIAMLLVFALAGCTSTGIPTYIPDQKASKKRFYATFSEAQSGVEKALEDLGWTVEKTMAPSVYEKNETNDLTERELLFVTEVRQTSFFLGTRYARMNIFLRSQKNISEIELRYITVTSTFIKTFRNYGDNATLKRIMERIEAELGGNKAVK